jgi:hypothetical protein
MRALVLVAGLSLFGYLPVDSAAADDFTIRGLCPLRPQGHGDSECSNAFAFLGVLYLVKHDYDRAVTDLGRALWFDPNNANAARAFWKALDERTRHPEVTSRSAASEAQDTPPQSESRQIERRPSPSYDPNDEIWREQQERDARENDWNLRQLQELNNRAVEEDREADRQRQLQDDQERWAREQQERERQEYQQRQDESYDKQNGD